jgi:PAS domain S-box-containing protein
MSRLREPAGSSRSQEKRLGGNGFTFATQPVRVLRRALTAIAGGHATATALALALNWDSLWSSVAALAVSLGGLLLLAMGRAFTGFALAVLGTVVTVLYSAYLENGILNVGMPALPTIIVLSSLLLNRRFLALLTTFSIAGLWLMELARHTGAARGLSANLLGDLTVLTVIIVLASLAGWIFSSQAERNARALWESEQMHRKVAGCVPDTLWTTDRQGRLTYVTPSAERTHGWTPEEAVGRSYREMVTPEQAEATWRLMEEEVRQARMPGYDHNRVVTFESKEQRRDGTTFDAEVTASLLWSDAGEPAGFVGATRDITERKRLQAELAQAQKMESIGRLAGGVAHDFNNHLTVINGYTRLVLDRTADSAVRAYLEEVAKAGERAAGLTRQLLAFSRRQMLAPKRLDLNRVVAEMAPMLERLMKGKVAVQVALGRRPAMVFADQHQLEQVVMNLAVNALDAMPDGGELKIETSLAEAPGAEGKRWVSLTVEDSGTGMDEETRQRIFEPFFTTKETGRGTGLGLAMVQGIVAQSGGWIEVQSRVGQGTRFRIGLPAAPGGEEEKAQPAEAAVKAGRGTVLVVEDQAEVRAYVADALRSHGYAVFEADGAEEALRRVEEAGRGIDLLITDVVMPRMGGPELARALARLRPELKVLFMSGYPGHEKLGQGQDGLWRAFLAKPFTPDELALKVRTVLEAAAGER